MGRPTGREGVLVAATEEEGTVGACGGPIRCCLSAGYGGGVGSHCC